MADTILFTVPALIGEEEAPTQVRLYQSTTLAGTRSVVATASLASLGYTADPPEELTWVVAAADPAKYSWLILLTAGSVEGQPALLPPLAASAEECTIHVSTVDLTGTADAGIKLSAKLIGSRVISGGALIGRGAKEFTTDVSGYLSFVVARGAKVQVDFPPLGTIQIDTTGKALIDLATEPAM